MPGCIELSPHASVKQIALNVDNLACAYLGNLYIPIFTLDTEKVLRRYEVPNQIAGIHFSYNKKNVIYAVDDSYGLHVFDVRSDTKKKFRLNPECENHTLLCTALSSDNDLIAVASSTFGGGILDVRGSRRRENHQHVLSLYDPRYPTDPVTTYYKRIKHSINSMEFYTSGQNIIVGDTNGGIKSFDTKLRDEDNAIRWEKYVRGPVTKVGVINKRIVYGISDNQEAAVFLDNKDTPLETLYGSVNDDADDPIVAHSKAYFRKPEWCIGLIKGVTDEIPIVAVHGVENKKFISLTAMNQQGVRQDAPLLSYRGHTGTVKCMKTTKELLLTGGEDGKVLVQISNFKNSKFGKDALEKHHPLTLNRGNLPETDKYSDDDEDPVGSNTPPSEQPSTSSAAGPSSSSSKPKSEKHSSEKKEKKEDSKDADEKRKRKEEREKEKRAQEKKERKERKEEKMKKEAEKEKERKAEKEKKRERSASPAPSSSTSKSDKKKEEGTSSSKSKSDSERKKEKEKTKEKKTERSSSPTPGTSSSSSMSSREAARLREIEREKMLKGPMTDEQKKAWEEREKRRLAKLAETPEERAIRKQKAREEREKARQEEKLREERKKKRHEERVASEGSASEGNTPKRRKNE